MSYVQTYGKELVALLVPFIAWFLNRFFQVKAKLNISSPHGFVFLVDKPIIDQAENNEKERLNVSTKSYILVNAGRVTLTNIEVVFNWKPMCINLWPIRSHKENIEDDRRCILLFNSMAPGEMIGLEILEISKKLPELVSARCDQCSARNVIMYPQPAVSNIARFVHAFLVALGLGAGVYLVILLIQFLVLQTPVGP